MARPQDPSGDARARVQQLGSVGDAAPRRSGSLAESPRRAERLLSRGSPGPSLVVLSLLSLAVIGPRLLDRGSHPVQSGASAVLQGGGDEPIGPPWALTWVRPSGVQLEIRPWHREAGRQSLESAALARRYGLGRGEVYRIPAADLGGPGLSLWNGSGLLLVPLGPLLLQAKGPDPVAAWLLDSEVEASLWFGTLEAGPVELRAADGQWVERGELWVPTELEVRPPVGALAPGESALLEAPDAGGPGQ